MSYEKKSWQFKECQQLGLSFWECPTSMFLFISLLTAISLVTTYFIASRFGSPEIAIGSISVVTAVMMIINFSIHHGISRAADAKNSLESTNKRLETALKKLREAEKAKEEFMYMIVHDLRSPLNGIRMLSEMMLSGEGKIKHKVQKESLRLVNHSTNRMLGLVNDLLDFSKMESGRFKLKKRKQAIASILEKTLSYFLPIADSKGVRLLANIQPKIPETEYDQQGIEQVLHNLLSNSLKFTDFGKVVVDAFLHKKNINIAQEAQKIHAHWITKDKKLNRLDDCIVVAVSDTGSGIVRGQQKKLFKKFVQADRGKTIEETGSGLGLFISKKIIEAHKGVIGLESEEGKGSTFYFNLPL